MNRFIVILLLSSSAFAQSGTLETIFANESNNVALFFPSPVRQGIVGAENFTFSFNENTAQHFGLLKGLPGKSSNLLVLTMNGQVYSYLLKYKQELSKLNYFIDSEESIGNETPIPENEAPILTAKKEIQHELVIDSLAGRHAYLEKLSAHYLRGARRKLKRKRRKGLVLEVKDLIYYKNDVFMVFEVENKSRIDFQLNYLNVYVSQGNSKRNASYQKLLKEPVYSFAVPKLVKAKEKNKFLYVFSKFTLGGNEKIEVEMREEQGSRGLMMVLKKRNIKK